MTLEFKSFQGASGGPIVDITFAAGGVTTEVRAFQDQKEFATFIELLKAEQVNSYLEIGSRFGGSLLLASQSLPTGARIVSVDIAKNDDDRQKLKLALHHLLYLGYDTHFIHGDSGTADVISKVRTLGPFDLVFIDGSHIYKDVKADWKNYGPMARLVAFHDISADRPPSKKKGGPPTEVHGLWVKIKEDYRHAEFISDPTCRGIGVLWRIENGGI